MMSASSFSILPPEVICQMFEFADDFSEVAALAQTARIFYYTWREHPTSICQAIAPRAISNLTDAERLLGIQQEAEAATQSQYSREQIPMIRAKRFLLNARCASAASVNWADLLLVHNTFFMGEELDRREDPYMTPSEIIRFKHAFYRVWTIGVMNRAPHLKDQALAFLNECGPKELCRLDEFVMWARSYNENNFGFSGLDLEYEIWRASFDLVSKRWSAYIDGKHISSPVYAPFHWFAFFDHTQSYIDMIEDE